MNTRWPAVALALVSLVVCAWFVLSIRQAQATTAASAIVTGTSRLPAAQAEHVASLLSSAQTLNPDRQVDVLRGELELGQGDRVAARRILEQVVAREPENVLAWEWLARASVGDLREFYLAAYRIRQLLPPVR
jgi:predicted Zn-dependent protease